MLSVCKQQGAGHSIPSAGHSIYLFFSTINGDTLGGVTFDWIMCIPPIPDLTIEVRICGGQHTVDEDTPVELDGIYTNDYETELPAK